MRVLSVNVGRDRTQVRGTGLERTGIYKVPVPGLVHVAADGIERDFICDQKNHGGPDQAIYVYGATDYAWWAQELGRQLEPGTFGENLTISNLESTRFNIGDRLRIGALELEITAPRFPCSTLAARMGDPKFAKKFRFAARPGLYCRIVTAGTVEAGDEVRVVPYAGETISTLEMFREHYRRDKDEALLHRMLNAPISIRARNALERDLQQVLTGRQP